MLYVSLWNENDNNADIPLISTSINTASDAEYFNMIVIAIIDVNDVQTTSINNFETRSKYLLIRKSMVYV